MAAAPDAEIVLHAGCVAWTGQGVLILGPSGSGKSALALQLMAYGCDLVSDDRTRIGVGNEGLVARPPTGIEGRIEARGVGILAACPVGAARIALAVDLDRRETDRLPPRRSLDILGIAVPLLHNIETAYFPAAILQYLKRGRVA